MRIIKHICFLTFGLVIFATLLSCSGKAKLSSDLAMNQNTKISNSNTNQFDVAEFERNRELWTSKNIQNYKMIIGASGFMMNFPEEVLIEVRNRQAKSMVSKTDNKGVDLYKNYNTVEKIFDFIEREHSRKADKLHVKFDDTLGYPTAVNLDERVGMSDDELSLKIVSLEVEK